MRKLFTGLLVVNLLFEGLVGLVLILGIDMDGNDALGVNSPWAMDYGFAAIVFASMIFWVWSKRNSLETATLALGILASFHTGLAISTGIAVGSGDPAAASFTHGLLAVISIWLFIKRPHWCEA